MNRRISLAFGGLAVAYGVLLVVAPGLAGASATTRTVVVLIGAAAGVLAFRAFLTRRDTPVEYTDVPEVESKRVFPLPGQEFTDRLHNASRSRRSQSRMHVRNDLERSVVTVLTTYRGLDEDAAERAISDGSWTDDPYAEAFFTRTSPRRPLRDRIRDVMSGRTAFERRAQHVVSELDDITEDA